MKSKLAFLVKTNLKKKFSKKLFFVINFLLLILIVGVMNIDKIIEYFGGDFKEPTVIYVEDNAYSYEMFKQTFEANAIYISDSVEYEIKKLDTSIDEKKEEIIENKSKDIIIALETNNNNYLNVKVISYDYIDSILYQSIVSSLNNVKTTLVLSNNNISNEVLSELFSEVSIEREFLSEEIEENGELLSMLSNIVIPVFIVPIFLLIVMAVQFIGAEINEEKSSKSMEIIISSVSAKTHFLSKIIATNIFIITQNLLLLLYGAVGFITRTLVTGKKITESFSGDITNYISMFFDSGIFDKLVQALPIIILLILLTFLIYSLFAGILASMTTSIEDFQQLQTPLFLVLMLAYYLAIIASVYDKALFIKIFSFIPFISGILAPVLFLLGQITYLDMIISILLLVLANYLFIHFGLKIYKVGILNYSSSKLWKKMFDAMKGKGE